MQLSRRLSPVAVLLPFVIGAAAVAVMVHVATILAFPLNAENDAFARVARLGAVGEKVDLKESGTPIVPWQDPTMVMAACRFDLSRGPFRILTTPFDEGFLSVGMHSRHGLPFYGLNLHADEGGQFAITLATEAQKAENETPAAPAAGHDLVVVSPETEGFVLIEAPASTSEGGRALLGHVDCAGAAPRPAAPSP